jgi:hypothetical protein
MMTPDEFTTAVKSAAEIALAPLKMRVDFRPTPAWKFGTLGHIFHFVGTKTNVPMTERHEVVIEGAINVREFEAKQGGTNFFALFVVKRVLEGCVQIHGERMSSIAFHWQKIEDLIGISPKPENNHYAEQKSRTGKDQRSR